MNELPFHHLILAMFGIAGLMEFASSMYETHWLSWSRPRRVVIALCLAPNYLYQALFAFQRFSDTSSLELLGFCGCVLGLFAAVRMFSMASAPASASAANPSAGTSPRVNSSSSSSSH